MKILGIIIGIVTILLGLLDILSVNDIHPERIGDGAFEIITGLIFILLSVILL